MVTSLLLALISHWSFAPPAVVSGSMEWEETPAVQKFPGYHPMLRFNRESTFIFKTLDFIAEGKYQRQGAHYDFHPLMAYEIENSDVDKLASDMDAKNGEKFRVAYFHSMANFDADYREATGTLHLNYVVEGIPKSFELHAYTEGDDQLPYLASADERGLPGLWSAPEPFPEKLDARTRYKIGGLEGLQQFFREARASDSSQFSLLDLRVDKTFRMHATVGKWVKSGSTLKLIDGVNELDLTISSDGRNLMSGGKAIFTRG
jgi:hypothetical protein